MLDGLKIGAVSGKGATWYNGGDFSMGDYAEFTTSYRWRDEIYQLSNDESVYVEPIIEEIIEELEA